MIATLFREAYLLVWSDVSRTIPDKKKAVIIETLKTGVLSFLFGFFVWNLDNIFCGSWTQVKRTVGWPIAFFMEGEFIQGNFVLFVTPASSRSRMVAHIHRRHILILGELLELTVEGWTGIRDLQSDPGRHLCVLYDLRISLY